MAQQRKSTSARTNSKRKSSGKKNNQDQFNEELMNEVIIIGIIAIAILLFLCNFGILGSFGNKISDIMFGLCGIPAFIFPILTAYIIFFGVANQGNSKAIRRNIALIVLFINISALCELISAEIGDAVGEFNLKGVWNFAVEHHKGGGIIGGTLAFYLVKGLGKVGTILLIIVVIIICLIFITEKSLLKGVKEVSGTSKRAIERGATSAQNFAYEKSLKRNERRVQNLDLRKARAEEKEQIRKAREEELRIKKEERENAEILNMKEVSGVPTYNFISEEEIIKERDDIHEINLANIDEEYNNRDIDIKIHSEYPSDDLTEADEITEINTDFADEEDDIEDVIIPGIMDDVDAPKPVRKLSSDASIFKTDRTNPTNGGRTFGTASGTAAEMAPTDTSARKPKPNKPYKTPPIDLLKKGVGSKGQDKNELTSTARKLEEVLASFNVKAKVTDVSQGPTVTRYELIPETGVKVSKILSLSDDLKLNLAAADIRIEAPIPGKAAIGIEVPNKVASSVALRDLIDSKEFKSAESKISFAVGKDLAGKVVVTDIAKMPHMLIAGATGSGKSVCINTLIMSILYKANPSEVKMIMIDPKVVELSVYNGIPHLLIPVVTDPKKANASLAWAVKEMDDRYQKFAEWGVRDLKGYNEKIQGEMDINNNPIPKMYQLVVIVDELADLMMVAGKEVEESICRLAQLARAAGIHLIIATQRPSVDVITGLIKANMPSRVAFSVSSGTDSRTILDMNGAEKLLGKGDMLFYPQGYTKPARIQGAFVSDHEVSDVVDFLKSNGAGYDDSSNDIVSQISTMSSQGSSNGASSTKSDDTDGQDEYFYEAGKLITESGKSSIGMLQRKFKIGFNRAARIMDALSESGVVGPEEGTKPRAILMTPEEFESMFG